MCEKVISILWTGDWNAGGVHNSLVDAITFGVINGKAKKLTINDVYDPQKAANDIFYIYNHRSPTLQKIQDKEMTKDDILNEEGQELLNTFTLSKNYITFYRKCYEFGYGYESSDFVKLPLRR